MNTIQLKGKIVFLQAEEQVLQCPLQLSMGWTISDLISVPKDRNMKAQAHLFTNLVALIAHDLRCEAQLNPTPSPNTNCP